MENNGINMGYVWWAVGVIVLIAAAYFIWGSAPTPEAGEQGAAATEAVSREGSGTFADLASLGGSYECTVSMDAEGAASSGTVYVSDGNVRAEFASSIGEQTVNSSMLQTGGYIYTWSDMLPQGFKMPVPAGEGEAAAPAPTQGFDPSASVQYECNPWAVDASVFEVPADVTFMEAPAM